jgi:predicted P-loop ATPase
MDEVIDTTAHRRRVNPVRDYLEALVWDGKPRVEECLPGVTPTAFTRMVARKSMVAAVARALNPGCKWDHTLVLYGSEGLGKSFWIEKMSRGYMASLGPLREKDTLLTMQRSWIMVADEGHSLRKTDNDVQKEFLTRTEDVFRMPYDRDTVVHKRHCVIWSTTNDETFLRRQEGNRRYLIVHCETKVDFNALTPDYVDQVWAEAVYLFKQGERLFLDDLESMAAVEERERFVEEDALAGVLSVYLETLVPEDWEEMSPERRVEWLRARNEGLIAEPGTERITRVSTIQLWVEALGRTKGTARRTDLLDIGNTLRRLEGWEPLPGTHRTTWYGTQKLYGRQQTTEERFAELL